MAGAGRAGFAAASAVGATSAAIAAAVAMAGNPQRRIATVDCAVINRFTNAMSWLKCPFALASTKILE